MKDSLAEAKKYALRLLSYRDRTEKEIRERLEKKGFDDEHINIVINKLKETGLIDDIRCAIFIKEDAIQRKLLSSTSAKSYAIRKGIAKDVAEQIFNENEDWDIDNAKKLIDKKMRFIKKYPDNIKFKKIYNLLSRKGYSYEVIRKVLKEVNILKEEV